MQGNIYEFEDYLLDVSEQRLKKNGEDIPLAPKVFEVLVALVERHGHLISIDELMEEVWQDTFVEETNLRYCIHSLRKAFDKEFIETVPKRGYRFSTDVKSYTTEEFIKRHTDDSSIRPITPSEPAESADKTGSGSFISKTAGVIAVALLVTGAGLLGYYFWGPDTSLSDPKSAQTITVLPFSVIGKETAEISEVQRGLLDSMIFNLTKIRGLKVTPASDVQKFLGKEIDPVAVGRELLSDLVLEGSYRNEAAGLVRVNTRLIDVTNGKSLISESITAKVRGKIGIEQIVSLRIARRIHNKLALIGDEEFVATQNIKEASRKNYLTGQQILRNFEMDRRDEGVKKFEEIVNRNPDWAVGYAKYAEALVLLHGDYAKQEKLKKVIDKALKMDDKMPEAYLALAWYHILRYEWELAEQQFEKAIELNPNYAFAYHEYGYTLDIQRKFSEAGRMYKKAIELKPFDPLFLANLCKHYDYIGRFDLAINTCEKALAIEEGFGLAQKNLDWVYLNSEDYGGYFKKVYGDLSENEVDNNPLAKALKKGNIELYWQQRLDARLDDNQKRNSPYAIAVFYARLGEKQNTLEYLEKIPDVSPIYIMQAFPDPIFDFVRREPRFIKLMRRFNLKP